MIDLTDPAQIKAARRALGLTCAQLADALELEPTNGKDTVRFWESGKRQPSGPVRAAIRLLLERDGLLNPEGQLHDV